MMKRIGTVLSVLSYSSDYLDGCIVEYIFVTHIIKI